MIAQLISSKHMSAILKHLGWTLIEVINSPNISDVPDILEKVRRAIQPGEHHSIAISSAGTVEGYRGEHHPDIGG